VCVAGHCSHWDSKGSGTNVKKSAALGRLKTAMRGFIAMERLICQRLALEKDEVIALAKSSWNVHRVSGRFTIAQPGLPWQVPFPLSSQDVLAKEPTS
jgi:hypothetical protein